jgi:hypothetical protein
VAAERIAFVQGLADACSVVCRLSGSEALSLSDVRFTPKADILAVECDVRQVPITDITNLFDHLVGEDKDRIRHRYPDRLCGSEVEDQVELRGLFHG